MSNGKQYIESGKAVLGIEFGSTRIKAVLVGEQAEPLASGAFTWQNRYENGNWTYYLDDALNGLRECYSSLLKDVSDKFGCGLKKLGAIGISAMMHGYLPFDKDGKQLTAFRTWRNTTTEKAADELSRLFEFNIPQRWSIAHLYQAILNGEEHIGRIGFMTTLAGYIHMQLTGERVLGIGDASGMFPVDENGRYDAVMLVAFDALTSDKGFRLEDVLPSIVQCGENAGFLTEKGAALLDPTGELEAGIPLCPPEGDAGTGMVATNSVDECTGNVSAGTSVFAMLVLDKALTASHKEIDVVTTPEGKPVAMVHCNNCSSDLDAWAQILMQFSTANGMTLSLGETLGSMCEAALNADADCGGLVAYNYLSGEPVTETVQGRPMLLRTPDSVFSFANFARCLLYSALASLKIGVELLIQSEGIAFSTLTGHGGFFKSGAVGQSILAAALNTSVTLLDNAGEGGAWGMAVLATFLLEKNSGEKLGDYLKRCVFNGVKASVCEPSAVDVEGFNSYLKAYKLGLTAEKSAAAIPDRGNGGSNA